jgi:hypothetical protein
MYPQMIPEQPQEVVCTLIPNPQMWKWRLAEVKMCSRLHSWLGSLDLNPGCSDLGRMPDLSSNGQSGLQEAHCLLSHP